MVTIFEQMIAGTITSNKVFENDNFIVIEDLYPQAPVHLLIIPKKHFACLQEVGAQDLYLLQEAMTIVQMMAKQYHIENGYRVVINNGEEGGQSVFHLHIHLLGGTTLGRIA